MLSGVGILHLHAAMGKFTYASLTLQRKSRFKTKDMKRECRRAYEYVQYPLALDLHVTASWQTGDRRLGRAGDWECPRRGRFQTINDIMPCRFTISYLAQIRLALFEDA